MSSTSTTPVHLPPPPFPYPIKITSVDAAVNSDVQRGTRLLSYSFLHIPKAPGSTPEPRYGTWDSSLEGTLVRWNVQPGDKISEERARKRPVVIISEPCKHGMQHAGMCVLCGKDMTKYESRSLFIEVIFSPSPSALTTPASQMPPALPSK